MKQRHFTHKLLTTIAAITTSVFMSQDALAVNTEAGTTISNSATVNYSVGGNAQDAIDSQPQGGNPGDATTFLVDNKIDHVVATTDTSPGVLVFQNESTVTDNVLTFTVTNEGNAIQDYRLVAVAAGTGEATAFNGATGDDFDMPSVQVFVEDGTNAGYQPAEDTATFIDELTFDTTGGANTVTVYIVDDNNPSGQVNGEVAAYHLVAVAAVADTAEHNNGAGGSTGALGADEADDSGTADVAGTVQNVFAEDDPAITSSISIDGSNDEIAAAANDGQHSAVSDYVVRIASLTITKTSQVISDPFSGTTNPKAIPGAIVEYIITVANAGGAEQATGLSVSDSLATEIGNGTIVFADNQYSTTKDVRVINGTSGASPIDYEADNTDDAGGITVEFNNLGAGASGANAILVGGLTVDAGQTATVRFRVEIL